LIGITPQQRDVVQHGTVHEDVVFSAVVFDSLRYGQVH